MCFDHCKGHDEDPAGPDATICDHDWHYAVINSGVGWADGWTQTFQARRVAVCIHCRATR